MNIVKFKDIILTEENAPALTPVQRDIFNTKFRGKYTYAVDWLFNVAMEDMTQEQYVESSRSLVHEEFGNVYTRINSFQDLLDKEGKIDINREYILGWSSDTDTHIPGFHGIKEDNWKSGYYPDVEINDFVLSDKFIITDTVLDQKLFNETKLRVLPLVEQDNPERTYDLDGYGEAKTTRYLKSDTKINIHCEFYGKLVVSGWNDDDVVSYIDTWVNEGDDIEVYAEDPERYVIEIQGQTEDYEPLFDIQFTYSEAPELPEDGFFVQDINYPYSDDSSDDSTNESESESYDYRVNTEYYYSTQSGNNVSYGPPRLVDETYKRGSIQAIWRIGDSTQGPGLLSYGNNRYVCYNGNQSGLRFNLYNPGDMKVAGLYRREVIEPQSLKDFDNIPYDLLKDLLIEGESIIDVEKTDLANDVTYYLASNKYNPDSDITLEELKNFRTWLATYLLAFDQDEEGEQKYTLYDDNTTHMLQYYVSGMYDDVVKYLSAFNSPLVSLSSTTSACGCNGIGTVGGLVTQNYIQNNVVSKANCGCDTSALAGKYSISSCDPIMIYKRNIYIKMVETFSKIDFWTQFASLFLVDFKKYIDGIIGYNLPLTTSQFVSVFADCGCLSQADAEQQKNIAILKELSKSLQYIIDNEVSGHKNFIQNAFTQWSSLLYENMQWS